MLHIRSALPGLVSVLLGSSVVGAAGQAPVERMLTTSDGVMIPALEYRSSGTEGQPFVLLFHQGGGSGPAEYEPIAPRIHAAGFNVLVIDQRRGGDRFGSRNLVAERFDPATRGESVLIGQTPLIDYRLPRASHRLTVSLPDRPSAERIASSEALRSSFDDPGQYDRPHLASCNK